MVLWQIQVRYIHAPVSSVEIHVSEIIYFSGLARYYVLGPQNLMCGAIQCSMPLGPRVFRCSPRSGNQYASRLCPFYANTSNGIVAGPSMTSTSMRSSAQLKSVVLKSGPSFDDCASHHHITLHFPLLMHSHRRDRPN